jgi:WhiB family transcriptional regulator, redox-sensing transcriptional regulator
MFTHLPGRPISHNTYTNWGCRCEGCRDDHRRYRNLIRAKQRQDGVFRSRSGSAPMRNIIRDRASRGWAVDAACVDADPDLFFPMPGESQSPAKQICRGCLVREQCLEYAVTHHEIHGIWGGRSERERKRDRGRLAREMAWRAS